jgi:hypothetical protein
VGGGGPGGFASVPEAWAGTGINVSARLLPELAGALERATRATEAAGLLRVRTTARVGAFSTNLNMQAAPSFGMRVAKAHCFG